MSTDPAAAGEHDGQNGKPASEVCKREDFDNTPRSEAPGSVKPTPSGSNESGPWNDYFAPIANSTDKDVPIRRGPGSIAASLSSRRSSPIHVQSPGKQPVTDILVSSGAASERPAPQRETSTQTAESSDSSATIRPAPASAPLGRPRPAYPNQSFAALQGFQYPHRGHPPTLRQRSSQPSQILTFSSAIASLHQSGSRTAGNSPAATPGHGLYTPATT